MRHRPALLDVNFLVALAWPNHIQHARAASWFAAESARGWATTPITECGFVRVSTNRAALATATTAATAIDLLRRLTVLDGHEFWPDDVRFVTQPEAARRLRGHRQVTDSHLVTLARGRGGRLVTFDAGLRTLDDRGETVAVLACEDGYGSDPDGKA